MSTSAMASEVSHAMRSLQQNLAVAGAIREARNGSGEKCHAMRMSLLAQTFTATVNCGDIIQVTITGSHVGESYLVQDISFDYAE